MIVLAFILVVIALALYIISIWLYIEYRTSSITTHLRNSIKLERFANALGILAFILFALKSLMK